MNHHETRRKLLPLALFLGAALAAAGCYAGVDGDVGTAYYPPPSFIATAQPVFYEGHAAYWYGGRWVYRDGARWGYYRSEPAYLGQRRAQIGVNVNRRVYERPAPARSAPRPPGRR